MQIGERLKGLREDKDLTQDEIATAIGITRRQYIRYEKDEQEMSINKIYNICIYYGVSADYILGLPEGLAWPRPGHKTGYHRSSRDEG